MIEQIKATALCTVAGLRLGDFYLIRLRYGPSVHQFEAQGVDTGRGPGFVIPEAISSRIMAGEKVTIEVPGLGEQADLRWTYVPYRPPSAMQRSDHGGVDGSSPPEPSVPYPPSDPENGVSASSNRKDVGFGEYDVPDDVLDEGTAQTPGLGGGQHKPERPRPRLSGWGGFFRAEGHRIAVALGILGSVILIAAGLYLLTDDFPGVGWLGARAPDGLIAGTDCPEALPWVPPAGSARDARQAWARATVARSMVLLDQVGSDERSQSQTVRVLSEAYRCWSDYPQARTLLLQRLQEKEAAPNHNTASVAKRLRGRINNEPSR